MEKDEIKELTAAVYQIVALIPIGRATSYGAIARAIGHPDHSRLVGRIMGACDSDRTGIPAHRVVNSQGILSARTAFETPSRMQELLQEEGIIVHHNRIVNWKKIYWNPLDEL